MNPCAIKRLRELKCKINEIICKPGGNAHMEPGGKAENSEGKDQGKIGKNRKAARRQKKPLKSPSDNSNRN